MARIKMITRTVDTTDCMTMICDIRTATVTAEYRTISGHYDDPKEALKVVQEMHDTDTLKCVNVMYCEPRQTLYGMPEEVFIQFAQVLPPRKQYDGVEG